MNIKQTDSIGNYVSIKPIKTNFTDSINANILTVHMNDDTITCVVSYKLYNFSTTTVSTIDIDTQNTVESVVNNGQEMFCGNVTIQGNDYTNWTGDSKYVYNFVATQIGLVIQD